MATPTAPAPVAPLTEHLRASHGQFGESPRAPASRWRARALNKRPNPQEDYLGIGPFIRWGGRTGASVPRSFRGSARRISCRAGRSRPFLGRSGGARPPPISFGGLTTTGGVPSRTQWLRILRACQYGKGPDLFGSHCVVFWPDAAGGQKIGAPW